MLVSLSKASKLSNKSKSVLSGAIKSGRLSAGRNIKGHWEIDTAELFRVYPKAVHKDVLELGTKNANQNKTEPPKELLEHKLLEQKIEFKDEKILILEKQLQQAQEREQELRNILNQNTKLLTHYSEQQKVQEEEKPKRKGWLFR